MRRAKSRFLQVQDDDRLTGTRQLWPFKNLNLSHRQRCRFVAIRKGDLSTAGTLALKEKVQSFQRHFYASGAEEFFNHWYAWRARCRPKR